jgi:hypothetical protein
VAYLRVELGLGLLGMLKNNIYLSKLFLAMFHFTEYFIKKSIQNGFSLLIISAFLIYLSSGALVHYVSIPVFLISAVCWIYFGFKFKKLMDSVDEPTSHEPETNKIRIFKFVDSILSATILISFIFSLGSPNGNAIYFLVSVISVLFIIRIYQIVIISNYLKEEVRN